MAVRLPRATSRRSAVNVARRIVREGGALARAANLLPKTGQSKGRGNVVTETDFAVEVLAHRIIGSVALGLAYAACGRFDLFVQPFLYPWDIAAGLLQLEEAGGVISDRDGNPAHLFSNSVIAGSRSVQADFLKLTAAMPWRD